MFPAPMAADAALASVLKLGTNATAVHAGPLVLGVGSAICREPLHKDLARAPNILSADQQ